MIDPADPHVEIIARLELPLPLELTSAIIGAVAEKLEELGYTDVVLMTDGPYRIAGRRPGAPPREAPAPSAGPPDTSR